VARRPREREQVYLDGGRRTTQLMRDSLDSGAMHIRYVVTTLALLAAVLTLVTFWPESLQFANASVDGFVHFIAYAVACLLPLFLLWRHWRDSGRYGTLFRRVILWPAALGATVIAAILLFILSLPAPWKPGLERIAEIPMRGYSVEIVRTNSGAMSSYGIEVRQERQLLPGVRLVRAMGGFYPAYQATFNVIGPDTVQVSVPAYMADRPRTAGTRTFVFHRGLLF
jgi:hypothetical protein